MLLSLGCFETINWQIKTIRANAVSMLSNRYVQTDTTNDMKVNSLRHCDVLWCYIDLSSLFQSSDNGEQHTLLFERI